MTTRYVNTASTAGGDGTTNGTTGATRAYASLSEWEAAEQAALTEDHTVHCCGTAADTTAVTVDGWTPGSYRITITGNTGDSAGAHAGVYSTGKYRIESASSAGFGVITPIEDNLTVQNLIIYQTGGNVGIGQAAPSGLNNEYLRLVVRGNTTSSANGLYFSDAAQRQSVYKDNIVYGFTGYGIYVRRWNSTPIVANNTVVKCSAGFRSRSGGGITLAINNLAFGNTTDWSASATDWDNTNSAYNAFGNNGANCPGSTDIDLSAYASTDIFVDYTNDDFHLLTSGSAYSSLDNNGVGPSSNANVSALDIDRDTRSGTTTSIGADIIVAAGGTLSGSLGQFDPTMRISGWF